MKQALVCNWGDAFIGRRGEMMRGYREVVDSDENGKRGIVEKSSNGDVLEVAFHLDSDAIILGYPRYAEHTER